MIKNSDILSKICSLGRDQKENLYARLNKISEDDQSLDDDYGYDEAPVQEVSPTLDYDSESYAKAKELVINEMKLGKDFESAIGVYYNDFDYDDIVEEALRSNYIPETNQWRDDLPQAQPQKQQPEIQQGTPQDNEEPLQWSGYTQEIDDVLNGKKGLDGLKAVTNAEGETTVSLHGIFDIPVIGEEGNYRFAISDGFLKRIFNHFKTVKKNISEGGLSRQDAQVEIVDRFYSEYYKTEVTDQIKNLGKSQIDEEDLKVKLDEDMSKINIANFKFYNSLGNDLVGTYHKWEASEAVSPVVNDLILFYAKEAIKNTLYRQDEGDSPYRHVPNKGIKKEILGKSGGNSLYSLLSQDSQSWDALSKSVQEVQPDIDLENVLDTYFSMDFVAYLIQNEEYSSLFAEQAEALGFAQKYKKDGESGTQVQVLKRSIYCRTCGQFKKGGCLPSNLNWREISSSVAAFWEVDSKGNLVYKFPQGSENKDESKPIFENDMGEMQKRITSPEYREKVEVGCKMSKDGFGLACDPVPNLHQASESKRDLGDEKVPLEIDGEQLTISPSADIVEGIKVDPYWLENDLKRITGYLFEEDSLKRNENYQGDYYDVGSEEAKDIVKDFLKQTGHLSFASFSDYSQSNRIMKNERIKKYEKLTIVSDKVQKMLVNALLNNGKAEDLKEAEAMSVSELYSLAVPNLSTIAFKNTSYDFGPQGTRDSFREHEKFGKMGAFDLKEIIEKNPLLQTFFGFDSQIDDILFHPINSSTHYERRAFGKALDKNVMELRTVLSNARSINIDEGALKKLVKLALRETFSGDFYTERDKSEMEKDVFEGDLGEAKTLIPILDRYVSTLVTDLKGQKTKEGKDKVVQDFIKKTDNMKSNPSLEDLESQVVSGHDLDENSLAETVETLVDQISQTPPEDLEFGTANQRGNEKISSDMKERTYYLLKKSLLETGAAKKISDGGDITTAFNNALDAMSGEFSSLFENVGAESIPYYIAQAIQSKNGDELVSNDLGIPLEMINQMSNMVAEEKSFKNNLWHLNQFITTAGDLEKGENILDRVVDARQAIFGSGEILSKDQRSEARLIVKASIYRDLTRLAKNDSRHLSEKDQSERDFVLSIMKTQEWGKMGLGHESYLKNMMSESSSQEYGAYLGTIFGEDAKNLDLFINDYNSKFTGDSHPDQAIGAQIKQISPYTSWLRTLPKTKTADPFESYDTALSHQLQSEMKRIEDENQAPPEETDEQMMARQEKIDGLKNKVYKDISFQKGSGSSADDYDDAFKIMSAPFKVQKVLRRFKDKESRVIFKPKMRKLIATLLLGHYQNIANVKNISEQKLSMLRYNARYGYLPGRAASNAGTASNVLGEQSYMSAIIGKHLHKVSPHLTPTEANIHQAPKNAKTSNWYKESKFSNWYKKTIAPFLGIKSNISEDNWYLAAKKKKKGFAFVLITSDYDIFNSARNISLASKGTKYTPSIMPMTMIVPFDKFGSLTKVYEYNTTNKVFKASAITWEEAEIFAELGLMDLEKLNGK